MNLKCLFNLFLLILSTEVFGSYEGRFSSGLFLFQERDNSDTLNGESNDQGKFSFRSYYFQENKKHEYTFDLRDTNDLFSQTSSQRLELNDENKLSLYQLNLSKKIRNNKFYYKLGRFKTMDSNSGYLDGAEIGQKAANNHRYGIFFGLNRNDNLDFSNSENKNMYGLYYTYLKEAHRGVVRGKYIYSNNSLFKNELDDLVFYTNSSMNSKTTYSNIIFEYLLEKEKIEILNYSNWFRAGKFQNSININYSEFEEYNMSNLLDSYDGKLLSFDIENSFSFSNRIDGTVDLIAEHRSIDSNERYGIEIGGVYKKKMYRIGPSIRFVEDYIRDFYAIKVDGTYFRDSYDLNFNHEVRIKYNTASELIYGHQTSLSTTKYLDNNFLTTFEIMYAKNENISIYSSYFYLVYRFGDDIYRGPGENET